MKTLGVPIKHSTIPGGWLLIKLLMVVALLATLLPPAFSPTTAAMPKGPAFTPQNIITASRVRASSPTNTASPTDAVAAGVAPTKGRAIFDDFARWAEQFTNSTANVVEGERLAWKQRQAMLELIQAHPADAIALLIGKPPAALSLPVEPLNASPPAAPVGVPSELLERRPDIAAAERRVAEANARIGVAKAAYYPNVTLSASGGFQSASISSLLNWSSRAWSVGAGFAETIFDAGLRKATVEQFQADYDNTVAKYRQTVLTAFQQVEDNLATLRLLAHQVEQQETV